MQYPRALSRAPAFSLGAMLRAGAATLGLIALATTLVFFVDRPAALAARAFGQENPSVLAFFQTVTVAGLGAWYAWPSGIASLLCLVGYFKTQGARREMLRRFGAKIGYFFIATSAAGLVTDVLKLPLGRARPKLFLGDGTFGFYPFSSGGLWHSMPSGHTTTAFAVATALAVLFPKGRAFYFLCALLIGLSRIMVNAHYPADVVMGSFVGCSVALACRPFLTLANGNKG